ncbi:MAG: rRNA pseudouridine synthase [Candidatus Omnitrophica bacterium]|nr:rRNA pseudouridine synthase [Candidatus Omnitrophota bacterium]
MPLIRINKLLSQCGIASRRKADELIRQGAVSINGKVLSRLGVIVDTNIDAVSVKGEKLKLKQAKGYSYFLLNKPKDCITTLRDTHNRRTVMELLPKARGLFPVGRLDKDTTGLLLATNDGELAHRLMHPRHEIKKRYEVEVEGSFREKDSERLGKGVDIGDKRLSVCKILDTKKDKTATMVTLEIHEGRKRQIRRMFQALGYKVKNLKRVVYAGLELDIREGSCRNLTEKEVMLLKKEVGLL